LLWCLPERGPGDDTYYRTPNLRTASLTVRPLAVMP
jgi:hypothetical protein